MPPPSRLIKVLHANVMKEVPIKKAPTVFSGNLAAECNGFNVGFVSELTGKFNGDTLRGPSPALNSYVKNGHRNVSEICAKLFVGRHGCFLSTQNAWSQLRPFTYHTSLWTTASGVRCQRMQPLGLILLPLHWREALVEGAAEQVYAEALGARTVTRYVPKGTTHPLGKTHASCA